MEEGSATIKILKKSSLVNSKMGSLKEWVSFTLQVEITIWENLNSIKRMEGVCISGRANNQIFMKVSS